MLSSASPPQAVECSRASEQRIDPLVVGAIGRCLLNSTFLLDVLHIEIESVHVAVQYQGILVALSELVCKIDGHEACHNEQCSSSICKRCEQEPGGIQDELPALLPEGWLWLPEDALVWRGEAVDSGHCWPRVGEGWSPGVGVATVDFGEDTGHGCLRCC